MSGKNAKHNRPAEAVATHSRHEWRVLLGDGLRLQGVPPSFLHRDAEGGYTFRDDHGIVADFPAGTVTGVLRKDAPEAVPADPGPADAGGASGAITAGRKK
jgi:hypothetical protein